MNRMNRFFCLFYDLSYLSSPLENFYVFSLAFLLSWDYKDPFQTADLTYSPASQENVMNHEY